MIAYAGYMVSDHSNWTKNTSVQQQIPFLQLAGNKDVNFCPLSYASFKNNLSPEIYTGDSSNNLRFYELNNEVHWISKGVVAEMNLIDTNLQNFFALKNMAEDCPNQQQLKEDVVFKVKENDFDWVMAKKAWAEKWLKTKEWTKDWKKQTDEANKFLNLY